MKSIATATLNSSVKSSTSISPNMYASLNPTSFMSSKRNQNAAFFTVILAYGVVVLLLALESTGNTNVHPPATSSMTNLPTWILSKYAMMSFRANEEAGPKLYPSKPSFTPSNKRSAVRSNPPPLCLSVTPTVLSLCVESSVSKCLHFSSLVTPHIFELGR